MSSAPLDANDELIAEVDDQVKLLKRLVDTQTVTFSIVQQSKTDLEHSNPRCAQDATKTVRDVEERFQRLNVLGREQRARQLLFLLLRLVLVLGVRRQQELDDVRNGVIAATAQSRRKRLSSLRSGRRR